MSNTFIPPRFEEKVLTNIMFFQARVEDRDFKTPAMTFVVGGSGDGKTTMLKALFQKHDIPATVVSAASLAGEYEGQAAGPFRDAYLAAANKGGPLGSALLLDDLELSALGTNDGTSGTVNGSILGAQFLSLADNPFELRISNPGRPPTVHNIPRPPHIVATANNTNKLLPSILQDGRTAIVEWVPTSSEKVAIVASMFPALSEFEALKLVETFADRPVAFFARAGKDAVQGIVRSEFGDFTRVIADGVLPIEFARWAVSVPERLTYEDLLAAATPLAGARKSHSYLTPTSRKSTFRSFLGGIFS